MVVLHHWPRPLRGRRSNNKPTTGSNGGMERMVLLVRRAGATVRARVASAAPPRMHVGSVLSLAISAFVKEVRYVVHFRGSNQGGGRRATGGCTGATQRGHRDPNDRCTKRCRPVWPAGHKAASAETTGWAPHWESKQQGEGPPPCGRPPPRWAAEQLKKKSNWGGRPQGATARKRPSPSLHAHGRGNIPPLPAPCTPAGVRPCRAGYPGGQKEVATLAPDRRIHRTIVSPVKMQHTEPRTLSPM